MDSKNVRIDKLWLGPAKGNQLRVVHLPTGIQVLGRSIAPDAFNPASFEAERSRLLLELEQKVKEAGRS